MAAGGPLDTTRFTELPDETDTPAAGLWLMTLPEGIVALDWNVIVPTVREALVIVDCAEAWVRPTTSGTVTGWGPLEITRSTGLPGSAEPPPVGLWLITLPEGTVLLYALVTEPTISPAPVIAFCAAVWARPTTAGTVTGTGPADTQMSMAEPEASGTPLPGLCRKTSSSGMVGL